MSRRADEKEQEDSRFVNRKSSQRIYCLIWGKDLALKRATEAEPARHPPTIQELICRSQPLRTFFANCLMARLRSWKKVRNSRRTKIKMARSIRTGAQRLISRLELLITLTPAIRRLLGEQRLHNIDACSGEH